jgi:hypothetical protein
VPCPEGIAQDRRPVGLRRERGGRPLQALRGRRAGEQCCWNRGSHGASWAGDEVWRVDRPPAGSSGLDELERHGASGGARAEAFRDPVAEPDGGEGGLELVASTLSTRTLRMWGMQPFVGWSDQEAFAASRHC